MASTKAKPRRLGAFLCLIMGIIVLACAFLPIYTVKFNLQDVVQMPEGTENIADAHAAVTAYDAFKALIKKDHLIPENIETEIYKFVNKLDKNAIFNASGNAQAETLQGMLKSDSLKLYTYVIYLSAVIMVFSGALMVIFGLLGTLMRAKFFKGCNILFSMTALLGGAGTIAGTVLIGAKYTEAFASLAALSMSYFMILPVAIALISLICLLALRSKRKFR